MSLRHSILGLLAGRPLTGYEIKKTFDGTLAHAWNAHDSQIYPELHRMEEKGLITAEAVLEGRRQRRLNKVTEEGRQEFERWLVSPEGNRINRDGFVLRVFFFGLLADEDKLLWLESEEKRLEAELHYAAEILARGAELCPKSERAKHRLRWQLACADLHAVQVRARLEWIQSVKGDIGLFDKMIGAEGSSARSPTTAEDEE